MHSALITYGEDAFIWDSPFRPFLRSILPMFFCLSGFLVAGSLLRCRTIVSFLGLRFIRIYPALTVEVIISAFIIGPIYTTYSYYNYFSDPLFFNYLLNVTGHIQYFLPGVFEGNPFARTVNGQLWTVPWELICYVLISCAALVGIKKYTFIAPISVILMISVHFLARFYKNDFVYYRYDGALSGSILLISFMVGITTYLYRKKITANAFLAVIAIVVSFYSLWSMPLGEYVGIISIGYVVCYIGTSNPKKIYIVRGADYSYGIYLYGFVIQQAFAATVPSAEWYTNIIVCVPLAALVAAISWHFVEKPALGAKKYIFRLEEVTRPAAVEQLGLERPRREA